MAGAVRYPDQAQFHPLKFISTVSEGLHIYEHTAVRELAGTEACCSSEAGITAPGKRVGTGGSCGILHSVIMPAPRKNIIGQHRTA